MVSKTQKNAQHVHRVLIIEDHPVVCLGLQHILSQNGRKFSFTCAAQGQAAIGAVREHAWDLICLNIGLTASNGFDLLKEIRDLRPESRVLVLSAQGGKKDEISALRMGAAGFICTRSTPDQILLAAQKILEGGKFVSRGIVAALLNELNCPRENGGDELLSKREQQILAGLVAGKSMKEIAYELNVSPKTVCTYRARVCEKLSVTSNAAIVRYAIEHGLVA